MIIVISIGAIITFFVYLFGFIFIIYLIDKIVNSINELLTIININIPHINNLNIQMLILLIIGSVIVLVANDDYKEHMNENGEAVYRKEWQKILDIFNVVMVYPIFTFFSKLNYSDNKVKIYMLSYAVIFLAVYVLSHYYIYINKQKSSFDKICSKIYKIFTILASIIIAILVFSIYSFVIYLHDFSNVKNIFVSIFYYIFIIFSTVIFSVLYFPSSSKNQALKSIISDYIYLILLSIIIGFSSFYNLFFRNISLFSIHSLILIDIFLILFISIILLPIKIKNIGNGT